MQSFRIQFFVACLIASILIAPGAKASDTPRFAKAGDWVEIADLGQIISRNPESQAQLVMLDSQTKLDSGTVSTYFDIAIRIESSRSMSDMASIFNPTWLPGQGELLVHRFEIIRDEDTIDLTKKDDLFQVIRREMNLERQMINGQLTALSQIEDLQLSDIVRISYTITTKNDALAGRLQHSMGFIEEGLNIDFLRQTVRWPETSNVLSSASNDDIQSRETAQDGWTIVSFQHRPKAEETEIPKNAPQRFKQGHFYEFSSFSSWEDVSQVNAALYSSRNEIVDGGELDREIRAIAEQTTDKRERISLALRMVQDKVRYLYNGLGFGNYAPQSPEETWKLRYGDCKAKTYLLLATLRRLGIKSEPMLVSFGQRDAVETRLPSFQPFDHIIVRAELDGQLFWLDGTLSGTRLADIGDAPIFRFGLPSREEGASLEAIDIRPLGRPFQSVQVVYDLSAGTELPATFELQATLRDADARKLKEAASQLSNDRAREVRDEIAQQYVISGIVAESEFRFDEDSQTGFLRATGLSYLGWETKTGKRWHEPWSAITSIDIQEARSEEALRDLPVQTSYPTYFEYQTTYILPERYAGYELSGKLEVDEEIGGYKLERSGRKSGLTVTLDERYYTNRWELEASDLESERQKLSSLKRKKLKVLLPATAPQPWHEAEDFGASIDLTQHKWAFDQRVANAKDDDETALTSRAYFYQLIGQYDLAITDLEAAQKIESDPETLMWLADLQLGSDQSAAIANFTRAIAIRPTYFNALVQLTRLELSLGNFDAVEELLAEASANGLADRDLISIRIELLQAQGQFDEAMQLINGLIEEEPDNAFYLADRCMLRSMQKTELEMALVDCDNMIEIAERSAYYHFLRGLAYYQSGDYSRALIDLNKAIDAESGASYLYNLRSAIHAKSGNEQLASDDRKAAEFFYKFAGWHWNSFIQ